MAKAKAKKAKPLPFGHKLVLNQWIVSLFGFDPLKDHKDDKRTLRPMSPIASTVKDAPEGMNAENLHHFYRELDIHLQQGSQITREDLLPYAGDKREAPAPDHLEILPVAVVAVRGNLSRSLLC